MSRSHCWINAFGIRSPTVYFRQELVHHVVVDPRARATGRGAATSAIFIGVTMGQRSYRHGVGMVCVCECVCVRGCVDWLPVLAHSIDLVEDNHVQCALVPRLGVCCVAKTTCKTSSTSPPLSDNHRDVHPPERRDTRFTHHTTHFKHPPLTSPTIHPPTHTHTNTHNTHARTRTRTRIHTHSTTKLILCCH